MHVELFVYCTTVCTKYITVCLCENAGKNFFSAVHINLPHTGNRSVVEKVLAAGGGILF